MEAKREDVAQVGEGIDPATAAAFDDAVRLALDRSGQWVMWVTLSRPTCSIRQVASRGTLTFHWDTVTYWGAPVRFNSMEAPLTRTVPGSP